jgi:hypothetical protein
LVNVGKHRNGIIAVDGDTYEDSSALPASIQYGRSASHTLRIVCPNGHLGFAPIKTGLKQRFGESRVDLMAYGRTPWS